MPLRIKGRFNNDVQPFNMTPIIDIVFLLIIFFLVVCQFIGAENFPVTVPDDCRFAQDRAEAAVEPTTVTVMKTTEEGIAFAVGSEKIAALNHTDIAGKLAKLIDVRLKDLPPDRRIVTLRIDRDVCFSEAQYVLAGVAASCASDIRLAVIKEQRSD